MNPSKWCTFLKPAFGRVNARTKLIAPIPVLFPPRMPLSNSRHDLFSESLLKIVAHFFKSHYLINYFIVTLPIL